MTLHLIKLAVGVASLAELRARQAAAGQPLCHTTRHFPRRAEDILDGGSIYWVISRVVLARQRLRGIVPGTRIDGSSGCDLLLDPDLVPVRGRFMKPFQGWRYLRAKDAPADDAANPATAETLPEELARELRRLALL